MRKKVREKVIPRFQFSKLLDCCGLAIPREVGRENRQRGGRKSVRDLNRIGLVVKFKKIRVRRALKRKKKTYHVWQRHFGLDNEFSNKGGEWPKNKGVEQIFSCRSGDYSIGF